MVHPQFSRGLWFQAWHKEGFPLDQFPLFEYEGYCLEGTVAKMKLGHLTTTWRVGFPEKDAGGSQLGTGK